MAATPKTAALYARVSTSDQNAEAQIHALRDYAGRRGIRAVEFVDSGVSGAKASRGALDQLRDSARLREIDLVVVTKLDRLARSVRHLTNLGAELEALGVDLVVLDQGIDTTTPSGRLLFHMLGAIAEFELDLIRERTLAGLEAARRRGKRLGRPLKLDRRQRDRIRRLRVSGRSLREIARVVGVSHPTVLRALSKARLLRPSGRPGRPTPAL